MGAVTGVVLVALSGQVRKWRQSRAGRRITDEATRDSRSAVAGSTTATTPGLPPSLTPVETPSGPAAPGSGCAHDWSRGYRLTTQDNLVVGRLNQCRKDCGAFWLDGLILVPDAATTPSTSVRPGSRPSVPAPMRVESRLSGWTEDVPG